jgi:hypothetical protein
MIANNTTTSPDYRPFGAIVVATLVLTLSGCGQVMLAHELNALNARFENRLQLTKQRVPALVVGEPYTAQLAAAGGVAPYHWTIAQGELPRGLTLDALGGTISGMAQGPFEQPIVVELTDSSGDSNEYVLGSLHPESTVGGGQ